ncbi:MAG: hypothetical protein ACYS76_04535 [Planctomycetota bacterium]|jgi:hypothetical protein
MSVRSILLRKDKTAQVGKVKTRHTHIKALGGLYVLASDAIVNYALDNEVLGSEIIWFEGNPNPLTWDKGLDDKSGDFLGDMVIENALKQTAQGPTIDIGGIMSGLSWLKNPINWIWLMLGLAIGWSVLKNAIAGTLFG